MRTADTPTAIDKATKHSSSSAHNPTPACDSTPARAAPHTAGQVVFLTGASSGIGKSTAIRAKRPKTRYLVGFMARPMLYARRVLGDRLFDRLIAFAWGRSW